MFARIANGWELAKESFAVLRMDKELLVFPLISGMACLLVLGSFVAPLWSSQYAQVLFEDGQAPQDPLAYVILFAFYTANYFVIVFFNAALVSCAIIRFKGGDPTVSDGLRAAARRWPQILAWSLVSATVGVVLKMIESNSEKAGQVVSALVGAAWSIVTYFVVPVLVVERVGPIDAIQRSFAVLKRTWGEALSANFGIGIITFLASLILGVAPIAAGIVAFVMEHMAVGGALLAAGVLGLMIVSLISSTLNSILLAALYLFAAEGTVPQHFNPSLLRDAFTKK